MNRSSNLSGSTFAHGAQAAQNTLVYNLPDGLSARSLSAVTAEANSHLFFVGTSSLSRTTHGEPAHQSVNELFLFKYSDDLNRIEVVKSFPFPHGEAWDTKASPYDKQVLAVSSQPIEGPPESPNECKCSIQLLKVDEAVFPADDEVEMIDGVERWNQQLEQAKFEVTAELHPENTDDLGIDPEDPLVSIQWEDSERTEGKTASELIACNSKGIFSFDLATGVQKDYLACADLVANSHPTAACKSVKRDPRNEHILAFTFGRNFQLVDLRDSKKGLLQASRGHATQPLMDLDYNPIKLHTLATAGQDSTIRFWDVRKQSAFSDQASAFQFKCLMEYGLNGQSSDGKVSMLASNSHSGFYQSSSSGVQSHWINKLKFNPEHDQLMLSCDTSTFVNLYQFSEVSSVTPLEAPLKSAGDSMFAQAEDGGDSLAFDPKTDSKEHEGKDVLIQRNELEDSVLGVEWSAADAWTFAAVSYDGTFFVNTIPSKLKYEIIL